MADELNIAYTPGASLEVAIYDEGWAQQGSNVAMSEIDAVLGLYSANMPASIDYGRWLVIFIDVDQTPDVVVGRGEILWDGASEIELDPQVQEVLVAAVGSTTTVVRTNAAKANNFYDSQTIVVISASNEVAARHIISYSNTDGAFTVDALPFTPASGDRVFVTSEISSEADVSTILTRLTEVWQLRGLDPSAATTFQQDKIFVGAEGSPDLEVILTGDGETQKVATRTP